jgi:hypothetical protein
MLKATLFRRFPPQSGDRNHPERYFDRATGTELAGNGFSGPLCN